jgi:hypothetical protein
MDGRRLREQICAAGIEQVRRWMDDARVEPATLNDVQRVVLNRTGVKLERIETDEDLVRIGGNYQKQMPALPRQLAFEFAKDTEALVFQRKDVDARSASRFVAVVDARGSRKWSAWFAERHEPCHIIIPDRSSASQPWRGTPSERPAPFEQVVDTLAAAIGFWEPMVRPVLLASLARNEHLLDAFDETRGLLAPDASREASYRAFARLSPFPLVMLRVALRCRKRDPANENASLALRVQTLIWNEAAEAAGMLAPLNYRIPAHSVIMNAESDFYGTTHTEVDDLGRWSDSRGRRLAARIVNVSARRSWVTMWPVDACSWVRTA